MWSWLGAAIKPSAIRDGFLDLLRKNRPEIERLNATRLKIAERAISRLRRR
jgi:hypothetical protein